MAITRIRRTYVPETNSYSEGELVVEHVGRVVSVSQRDYRAMSDVYTVATFAMIIQDDYSLKEILVNANFECDQSQGRAEVDISVELRAMLDLRAKVHAFEKEMAHAEARQAMRERAELAEKNSPVKGKKMRVVSGRKVPVGTIGTVAFISRDGMSALIKGDDVWQDRKVNGTWVQCRHLVAR